MIILILGIFIVGCKKDNDNEKPNDNYFRAGNTKYKLVFGSLENYGPDYIGQYEGYNLDLNLVSEGITFSEDAAGDLEISGTGHIIYFELFTSNSSFLDDGDYSYDETLPFSIGTFDYGDYAVNWDETHDEWIEINAGKVTVSKEGNIYEITIDCTDENGLDITGYYKGPLSFYNYE